MSPNHPCACEEFGCSADLEDTIVRVRRGERVLAVPQKVWTCAQCVDPDTGERQRFVDASLRELNHALADAAWRAHYGEALPPGAKPGRKPAEPLEERVVTLLTRSELARLDAARGERSRSEIIRDAVRKLVGEIELQ